MKRYLKTIAFALLLSPLLTATSYAQLFPLDPPITPDGPVAKVGINVKQSNVDFIFDNGIFRRGEVRNVAVLTLESLQGLGAELFGNGRNFSSEGVDFFITINDRAPVQVTVKFEAGEDEVIIGRAAPIDPTALMASGELVGRIVAKYDATEDELTFRYVERVDLNVFGSSANTLDVIDARRFEINVGFGFDDASRGALNYSASGSASAGNGGYSS